MLMVVSRKFCHILTEVTYWDKSVISLPDVNNGQLLEYELASCDWYLWLIYLNMRSN